jgi:putative PIN family toxin of toxin-antitoxin system
MYKIIIDANVWIKYARIKDIAHLVNRFAAYNFIPVINNYLLSEVFNALLENNWMKERSAISVIEFIRRISLSVNEKVVFRISPDSKDNYLFDIAVQNACVFIITDDSELLHFSLKPIPVHTSGWFLKHFPIEI